jgi:serine/threonine protein kinase
MLENEKIIASNPEPVNQLSLLSPVRQVQSEPVPDNYSRLPVYLETGRFLKCFDQIEEIGSGGFGTVFRSRKKDEMQFYAVKQIVVPLNPNQELSQNKFFREVKTMLESVHHQNLVRFYTCWWEGLSQQ